MISRLVHLLSPHQHALHGCYTRCPLMGACATASRIPHAATLIIGTEECSYYTKATLTLKGQGDHCYSVILDNHDVTFGSVDKVESAIHELFALTRPQQLFLITTCVVEIVGDDFHTLVEDIQQQYNIPVKLISTCHFKGDDEREGRRLVEAASQADASISIPHPRHRIKTP